MEQILIKHPKNPTLIFTKVVCAQSGIRSHELGAPAKNCTQLPPIRSLLPPSDLAAADEVMAVSKGNDLPPDLVIESASSRSGDK